MVKSIFRKRQNDKGQALVEFTLMFPILLAVLLGLIAMSMIFYSYVTLQLAVREGTSAIVKDPQGQDPLLLKDTSGQGRTPLVMAQSMVKKRAFALNQNGLTGTALGDCLTANGCIIVEPSSGWQTGVHVSIYATYSVPLPTFRIPLPGGSAVIIGPIPITAQSVMTIE